MLAVPVRGVAAFILRIRDGVTFMKYEAFRIPVRVVFYRESGDWIAHCLEFDLMGHGATQREALQRLSEAIEMQADAAFQHGNPANLFSPADGKFFRMFAAGDDCCQGELQIRIRGNNVLIERAEYREYAGTPMAFA